MKQYMRGEQPISSKEMWAALLRYCKKIGTLHYVYYKIESILQYYKHKSINDIDPSKVINYDIHKYAKFFATFYTKEAYEYTVAFEKLLRVNGLYDAFKINFQKDQHWIHNDVMHMGLTAQIKAFIMIYGPFPLIDAGFNWRNTSPGYNRWRDLSELWTHTIHEIKRA